MTKGCEFELVSVQVHIDSTVLNWKLGFKYKYKSLGSSRCGSVTRRSIRHLQSLAEVKSTTCGQQQQQEEEDEEDERRDALATVAARLSFRSLRNSRSVENNDDDVAVGIDNDDDNNDATRSSRL